MVRSRVDTSCCSRNSSSAMCRSWSSNSCNGAKVTCPRLVAAAFRTASASSSRQPKSAVKTRLSPRTAKRPRLSQLQHLTRESRSDTSSSNRSTTCPFPSADTLLSASTTLKRTKASLSLLRASKADNTCESSFSATFSKAFTALRRTPPSLSSQRARRAERARKACDLLATCATLVHATRRTEASPSLQRAIKASRTASSPFLAAWPKLVAAASRT
mmetsp:Transcript_73216/g.161635  ORF Transcript_73216/g.161635 Transcript_73216/m.161635 type:complete len:217 (+) Transcript_73216:1057-1707(+)